MATLNQEVLVRRVVDKIKKGEKVSLSKEKEGLYGPKMNVTTLKRSKGFQELLDKYLPDTHVLKKGREFLDSKKIVRMYKKGDLEFEEEYTDPSAVKALEIALRLRRRFPREGDNGGSTTINNLVQINIHGPGEKPNVIRDLPES